MSSYKDLEIFQLAFSLSIKIHRSSMKLPKFELYEQGSQIRRSSKSVKDTIVLKKTENREPRTQDNYWHLQYIQNNTAKKKE